MRSPNEHAKSENPNSFSELRLLEELEEAPDITQRALSQKLGIALGLTNTLLRNLAKRGFIRASQAGWNRYLYAITPSGLSHKIRLTVSYVRRVLDDYGKVRLVLRQELAPLALHEESRVAIYGTGVFAELVFLGLKEIGIEEIDFYSENFLVNQRFLGMPVRNSDVIKVGYYDKVVIANLTDPEDIVKMFNERGLPSEDLISFFSNGKINNDARRGK